MFTSKDTNTEDITLHLDYNSSYYSGDSTDTSIYEGSLFDLYANRSFPESNIDNSIIIEPNLEAPRALPHTFKTFSSKIYPEIKKLASKNHPNFYEGATLKQNSEQISFRKSSKNAINAAIANFHTKPKDRNYVLIDKKDISEPIWISSNEYNKIQNAYNKEIKQMSRKPTILKNLFFKEKLNKSSHFVKKSENVGNETSHVSKNVLALRTRESLVQAYNKDKKDSKHISDPSIFDQSSDNRKSIMNLVNDTDFFVDDNNNNKLKRLSIQIKSQYKLLNTLEKL